MRNEKSADRIYLVTRRENQVMSFLMHGSRAIEIHSDSYEKKSSDTVALGDIYIGRISEHRQKYQCRFCRAHTWKCLLSAIGGYQAAHLYQKGGLCKATGRR